MDAPESLDFLVPPASVSSLDLLTYFGRVIAAGNICLCCNLTERVIAALTMLVLKGQCTIVSLKVSKPFAIFIIRE